MEIDNTIYPLSKEVNPRDPGEKCMCNHCRHWSPLIRTLETKLDDEGKNLLDEFVNYAMNDMDDGNYWRCLAKGNWPGWEILKEYHPSQLMPKPDAVKWEKSKNESE